LRKNKIKKQIAIILHFLYDWAGLKYKMSKILIKIGSNVLTRDDFSLNITLLQNICDQVAELVKTGHQIGIVSSGAVAAGRHDYVSQPEDENLTTKRMLASIGQCRLLNKYHKYLSKHGLVIAQALLSNRDFEFQENQENIAKVLKRLFNKGYISIINENDVVSTTELKIKDRHFGDNDMLSAKTSNLIEADKLVILTDVDGLYDCNPKTNETAEIIHEVKDLNHTVFCFAEAHESNISRGGMQSKLEAAKFATQNSIETFIANGNQKNILVDLLINKKENIGTRFKIAN